MEAERNAYLSKATEPNPNMLAATEVVPEPQHASKMK